MAERIENRLAEWRGKRGLSAAALALAVGVSRQTIYAMEAGDYVPNTETSLRLARALEVQVEELFRLRDKEESAVGARRVIALSAGPVAASTPMRLARVGERQVGVPVGPRPYFLDDADAVSLSAGTAGNVNVQVWEESAAKRIVIAGCDPAIGLLAGEMARGAKCGLVGAPAASKLALRWLAEGKVHVAGSHLEDAKTGEFNVPYLRKQYPKLKFRVYTFAAWAEGWVTAPGNPKRIRRAEDLARRGVRLANREAGSGSRALLERLITEAGIEPQQIQGFEREYFGHLAAAYAVECGQADCCLASEAAARAFGLEFVAVRQERFDLIVREADPEAEGVRELFDILQSGRLRKRLEGMAGYETQRTGVQVS
jgi:molybdate-binding protein/DNA-binding XRE family transcriptional regulator